MVRSSSNIGKIFTCDYCGKSFEKKYRIQRHILHLHVMRKPEDTTCFECTITFKTIGFLRRHIRIAHNVERFNSESKTPKQIHVCYACQINFKELRDLKYHIRKIHFNLLTNVPYLHLKKVNQVWFENVMNSKNIVEMKKVGENMILIRKLGDNTAMRVGEQDTEILDLRKSYPFKSPLTFNSTLTEQCDICLKFYNKMDIDKHKAKEHPVC